VSVQKAVEQLREEVPFSDYVLLTTLPRGGMQIAQPAHLRESVARAYSREFAQLDRLSWEALRRKTPLLASEAWHNGEFESSRFVTEFLQGAGYQHAAVVPLRSPILAGYPGVLWLLRSRNEGSFTPEDLQKLESSAGEVNRVIRAANAVDESNHSTGTPLAHHVQNSHWVFADADNAYVGNDAFRALDPTLQSAIQDVVRTRLTQTAEFDGQGERISLADARGDLWNFYVATRASFPAIAEGPVVFVCLQPECEDWGSLRSSDFQADNELARLIPAIRFMHENFHRSPTLTEIAATVHLSPFHFHRRFSELLGITPKHFLLDCQIGEAKRLLVAREKELSELATLCGFAHQSHFTSRFKQATGLTPTRWRRLALEQGGSNNNGNGRQTTDISRLTWTFAA